MCEKWFGNKKNGVLQIGTYFNDHCVGDIELRSEEVRDIAKFIDEELIKQKERVVSEQMQGGKLNE